MPRGSASRGSLPPQAMQRRCRERGGVVERVDPCVSGSLGRVVSLGVAVIMSPVWDLLGEGGLNWGKVGDSAE